MKVTELESIKEKCTACQACFSVCSSNAIIMTIDEHGFFYPNISKNQCVDCGACIKVCQIGKCLSESRPWREHEFFECYSNTADIRKTATSGGVGFEIAKIIIENEGVVFGACMDDDLTVRHHIIQSVDQIKKVSGSKYLQSLIGDTYIQAKTLLSQGKTVLFTGTPCQIKGLYMFLGSRPDNLYTMDFICHGVPSYRVFQDWITNMKTNERKTVKTVTFREKQNGWKNSTATVYYTDGSKQIINNNKLFFYRTFLDNYSLRLSCYTCESSENHESDITVGDYWTTKIEDDSGVSLVCLNTEHGKCLFFSLHDKITVNVISDIASLTPCFALHEINLAYNKEKPKMFWRYYNKYGYIKCSHRYMSRWKIKQRLAFILSIPRRCIGFVKRKVYKHN